MKRIGLIGEDPNDTHAIRHLLLQHTGQRAQIKPILRNKKGSHLDNASSRRSLELELRRNDYDVIIFIRDLDGFITEEDKLKERKRWFNDLNKICDHRGILLLNVYELEALILADIETFNRLYKTNVQKYGDVMYQQEPKEILKRWSSGGGRKYRESDCPELFKKLSHETIRGNCKYYKDFINELDKRLE